MLNDAMQNDPYFKARLDYHFKNLAFQFDTAALLFSPNRVDESATLPLDQLVGKIQPPPQTVLELGCSYGVTGIVLAKIYPKARVVLADKDLLAVEYARSNAHLNGVENLTVVGSIGVESVPHQTFDWIIANVPTKIGDRAIEGDFVLGPLARLAPNGGYWFVTERSLNRLIPVVARRHKLNLNEVTRQGPYILYHIKNTKR